MKKISILLAILFLSFQTASARDFYSIDSGTWDEPDTWSTEGHNGSPSNYIPGENPEDNIIIGLGHTVFFNTISADVNNITINNGSLTFFLSKHQNLTVHGNLVVSENGSIGEQGEMGGVDTLIIVGDLTNNSSGQNSIDCYNDKISAEITIIFAGDQNSTISGEGNWDLRDVIIKKNQSLSYYVLNRSVTFAQSVTSMIKVKENEFQIASGVYTHNVDEPIVIDRDDGVDYRIGPYSGISILNGVVEIRDGFRSNNNTSIALNDGRLIVGNDINENFLYDSNTKLKIINGELIVAGRFSFIEDNNNLKLEISGGLLSVMNSGSDETGPGIFGFGISEPSEVIWNFLDDAGGQNSKILYDKQMPADIDVSIIPSLYTINGGNLQFGIANQIQTTAKQAYTMECSMPLWNLNIIESRSGVGIHYPLVLMNDELRIKNDMVISENGSFDLNTKTLLIEGDYFNKGRFTPDGRGWDSGGPQIVAFVGDATQLIEIHNDIINEQSPDNINNEPFFDLVVNKTSGHVLVGEQSISPVIRNQLEFTEQNEAIVDSRDFDKEIVIDPRLDSDLGIVIRNGRGHVDGKLIMPAGTVDEEIIYHIGVKDFYTPLTIHLSGEGGSAGKISAISNPGNPDNIFNNGLGLNLAKNIQRNWDIEPLDNFTLGQRNFFLILGFASDDIRNGADWSKFRMFNASSTPYQLLDIYDAQETMNKSENNTEFGTFVIAEYDDTEILFKGTVYRADLMQGLPNADVVYFDLTNDKKIAATTDTEGNYLINLPPDSKFKAMALLPAEKYIPQFYSGTDNFAEAQIFNSSEDIPSIDFYLKKKPDLTTRIYGAVTNASDEGTSAMVVLLMVESSDSSNAFQTKVVTNDATESAGVFSFENLLNGKYIIHAIPKDQSLLPGYYKEGEALVRSWRAADIIDINANEKIGPLKLLCKEVVSTEGIGIISGNIIGEELSQVLKTGDSPLAKKSVSGAMTFTVDENEKVRKYDFSKGDGNYIMSNLDTGSYTVIVDKFGYAPEEFEVTITDSDNDKTIDFDLTPGTSAVDEYLFGMSSSLKAYPNPASGDFTVEFDSRSVRAKIEVMNLLGRSVYSTEHVTMLGKTRIALDKLNLATGTYIILIQSGSVQYEIPLIMQ